LKGIEVRFRIHDEDFDPYSAKFDNDYLGRERVSRHLSDIVERIEDPLVISLDGPWGCGKSYFLKRWVGAHRHQNGGQAETIYFDAFEHDYLSDPLTSLINVISGKMPKNKRSHVAKLKQATYTLIKPVTKIALAVGTAGLSVAANEVVDAGIEALRDTANESLDEFWKRESRRHNAMSEFKKSINSLVEMPEGERKPLVIVVDELDRCRPDYALEVLEVIKHLFNVKNVHFVLGANLKSLENSVKARYGQGIEAEKYLQKFISFSMTLPEKIQGQNISSSLRYLSEIAEDHGIYETIFEELNFQIPLLSNHCQISLRDINKICSMISILPRGYSSNPSEHFKRSIFITLLITKCCLPSVFKKLKNLKFTSEELNDIFSITPEKVSLHGENGLPNPDYDYQLVYTWASWEWLRSGGKLPQNTNLTAENPFGIGPYRPHFKEITEQITESIDFTLAT
jgi:energy-coupling factor transporter ATP-binding protein EcfA2